MKKLSGWVLFLIMAIVPFFFSLYYVNILTEIFILAVFAVGLNLFSRTNGSRFTRSCRFLRCWSLCDWTNGSHVSPNVFLTIVVGMIAAAVLALVIGLFAIKAHGFYFLDVNACLFANCLFHCVSVDRA